MSLSGSSRNGSRQPSEDWVRQANDLRIDSPLITDPMNEALQGTIVERYPITDEDVMMVSFIVCVNSLLITHGGLGCCHDFEPADERRR